MAQRLGVPLVIPHLASEVQDTCGAALRQFAILPASLPPYPCLLRCGGIRQSSVALRSVAVSRALARCVSCSSTLEIVMSRRSERTNLARELGGGLLQLERVLVLNTCMREFLILTCQQLGVMQSLVASGCSVRDELEGPRTHVSAPQEFEHRFPEKPNYDSVPKREPLSVAVGREHVPLVGAYKGWGITIIR